MRRASRHAPRCWRSAHERRGVDLRFVVIEAGRRRARDSQRGEPVHVNRDVLCRSVFVRAVALAARQREALPMPASMNPAPRPTAVPSATEAFTRR